MCQKKTYFYDKLQFITKLKILSEPRFEHGILWLFVCSFTHMRNSLGLKENNYFYEFFKILNIFEFFMFYDVL